MPGRTQNPEQSHSSGEDELRNSVLRFVKWIIAVGGALAVFGITLSDWRPTVKFETDDVIAQVTLLGSRMTRTELRAARNQLSETQFEIDKLQRRGIRPDFKLVEQLNFWRGEVERLEQRLKQEIMGK